MTGKRPTWLKILGVLSVFVLAMVLAGGCSNKSDSGSTSTSATPPSEGTALTSLEVAQSSLATMAPDAKLLLVQTAQAVEPTGTPVWAYLFGDAATDKTYIVYVAGGQSMGAQEYGSAGLSEDDWANVPGTDEWKVDSNEAYTKALAVSGATGDPSAYLMGLMTFKSGTDTSTVEPFVWQVLFDPGESGATTKTITVDAKTGEAAVSAE